MSSTVGGQPGSVSLPLRLFDIADRVAERVRPLRLGTPAALIDRAVASTGLRDFGNWIFEEPLRVLMEAMEREADLSLFGRLSGRWDILRFLTNLLRMREAERLTPTICEQPIASPIFITGMPRSGTSFLHSLLAQDPGNQVPLCWQTIYPYPVPPNGSRTDPRPRRVARQLRIFEALSPEIRAAHPIDANSPQECTEITAYLFKSLRFDMTHHVPTYRAWLDAAGHEDAYRFHKRFLQHLQQQTGPGRWVLKCPDHVFALDAIREVYPDARIIFCHRDPLKVLPSVAKLTEIVRRPFTRAVDRRQIGQQITDRWVLGANRMMEAMRHGGAWGDAILHVHYRDLVADPCGKVEALYRDLGTPIDPVALERVRELVRKKPDGGYKPRAQRFADYGIDPAYAERRFAEYVAFFNIRSEAVERA
jgi:hypothetical protein